MTINRRRQTAKGKGYLKIAGSAGGPSIYTQVMAIHFMDISEEE